MFSARRGAAIAALVPVLLLAACSASDGTRPPGSGDASLIMTANVTGTAVAIVVVKVSAPDIAPTLVFNFSVEAGVASGTVTIPAGSNRTIQMLAYDAAGVQTHNGATTVTVQAGPNPAISLTLNPLNGSVDIHATLGSFAVTLNLAETTLLLGSAPTVELTASVLDAQGHTAGLASWATQDPGIATVGTTAEGHGLVTAVALGQTTIVATFEGAAGSATITVAP